MKQYKAYFLDFDGTLFDTYHSLVGVYQYAFQKIGETCTPEEVAQYMHMSLSECCEKRNVKDPAKITALYEAVGASLDFPEFIDQISIFPDVIPFLDRARQEGRILGIVSGNSPKHIRLVLARNHITDRFSFVIGADPHRRPKPFADPILAALREIPTLKTCDAVYIGDSLQDPEAASHARVDGVLLERNHEYPHYEKTKIQTLLDLLQ